MSVGQITSSIQKIKTYKEYREVMAILPLFKQIRFILLREILFLEKIMVTSASLGLFFSPILFITAHIDCIACDQDN